MVKTVKEQLVIIVVTRGDEMEQTMLGGFRLVDEVFDEAGLDIAPHTRKFWERLRVLQRALRREFGSRVTLRVLSPWTPRGLWFTIRHRLRGFPCLVIAGRRYSLNTPPNEIVEAVRRVLQ